MPSVYECLGPLSPYLPHTVLTRVQECVIPTLFQSDANVVVAAPTGSGKTALLEVAMMRLFRDRLLAPRGSTLRGQTPDRKAVYICPIKALAYEKYDAWKQRFSALSVTLETGDQDSTREQSDGPLDVPNADIIITTPERWDSITRRWKEGVVWSLVASVALLLLDEVHTVSEERGAALEAVVSRMKAIKASANIGPRVSCDAKNVAGTTRFVAISGTLPNIEDFAEWLQVEPGGVFSFTSADRPVPLTLRIMSYPSTSTNPFAFERFLSFKLLGLIRQYSEGRPSIVFCASRRESVSSAQRIAQDVRELAAREGAEERLRPCEEASRLSAMANDKQLRQLLGLGIAYHNAAMSVDDRLLVERMFKEQYLSVICTTTTLALGVNLPAHLVIIKGTTFFKNGRREDLPLSEVAQMSGRAGRPGLDTHGVALVLTTEDKACIYESLRHGDACTTVESRLHQNMIEHVNSEVALRTIHSFTHGIEWIKTTFLWIRLRRCPRHYGILFSTKEEEATFDPEQFAAQLMFRMLSELERQKCISIHRDGIEESSLGGPHGDMAKCVVESTRVGRAMSRRYILLKSVELLNTETEHVGMQQVEKKGLLSSLNVQAAEERHKALQDSTIIDCNTTKNKGESRDVGFNASFTLPYILGILSRCAEFEDLRLRKGDRTHLNEINKVIRFPLKSGMKGGREVREDWHKVYVLVQAHLEHIPINDFSLRNDSVRLWTSAPRIARFLVDYAATLNVFSFMKESRILIRCIEQRMWWDGPVLKQIAGVGESVAKALLRGGVKSFKDVLALNPRMLETLCGKNPPFGTELHQKCRDLPHCKLSLEPNENSGIVRLVITENNNIQQNGSSEITPEQPFNKTKYQLTVLVGDTRSDSILLIRQFASVELRGEPLVFTFNSCFPHKGRIVGCLFTEHFLGNDVSVSLYSSEGRETPQKVPLTSPNEEIPMRVQELGEAHRNTTTVEGAAAFDALIHDLRWVQGDSPTRVSNDHQGTLRTTEKMRNEGSSPLLCEGVSSGLTKISTEMNDETENSEHGAAEGEIKKLDAAFSGSRSMYRDDRSPLGRASEISSAVHKREDSQGIYHVSCKRPREDGSCVPSPSLCTSGSFCTKHTSVDRLASVGRAVVLPRVASPVPLKTPDNGIPLTQPPPPSARFRFGVRGLPNPCARTIGPGLSSYDPESRFFTPMWNVAQYPHNPNPATMQYSPSSAPAHQHASQPQLYNQMSLTHPSHLTHYMAIPPSPNSFLLSGFQWNHHTGMEDVRRAWHRGAWTPTHPPNLHGLPPQWSLDASNGMPPGSHHWMPHGPIQSPLCHANFSRGNTQSQIGDPTGWQQSNTVGSMDMRMPMVTARGRAVTRNARGGAPGAAAVSRGWW